MKLYKYRKFSEFLIRELCGSCIYFADPKRFNDPLDCSPVILNDLGKVELEQICHRMLEENAGKRAATEKLRNLRYHSKEPDSIKEQQDLYILKLRYEIENQLDHIMKNIGVLSLSSKYDSPLMWSHYADEHKGICLEFDTESAKRIPQEIDYEGNRGISTENLF